MSISQKAGASIGPFRVETTSGTGHPPEFWAERICSRLIAIADTAPPELRVQAHAFRDAMQIVVLGGIQQAILSNHTTLIARLRQAGMEDAAAFVYEMRRVT